jgi:hypothetical protein
MRRTGRSPSCNDTSEDDMHPPTWSLYPTRILTRRELAAVLADVNRQASRYTNVRRSPVIVRGACCCDRRRAPRSPSAVPAPQWAAGWQSGVTAE